MNFRRLFTADAPIESGSVIFVVITGYEGGFRLGKPPARRTHTTGVLPNQLQFLPHLPKEHCYFLTYFKFDFLLVHNLFELYRCHFLNYTLCFCFFFFRWWRQRWWYYTLPGEKSRILRLNNLHYLLRAFDCLLPIDKERRLALQTFF